MLLISLTISDINYIFVKIDFSGEPLLKLAKFFKMSNNLLFTFAVTFITIFPSGIATRKFPDHSVAPVQAGNS